jgi:hypothetical protein
VALETASYVANLVVTNPDGGDARSTADDHLRLIKAALVRTFPKVDSAVSISAAQVMYLNDLSASVQLQINQLRDGSATANNALYANSASHAVIALTANSASYAALAGQAASASFATLAATANSASFATLAGLAQSASYAAFAGQATSASFANAATTATNATFATTCTSASSAATLAGNPHDSAVSASSIAQRNGQGDLFARYFNQNSGAESPSVGHVAVMTGLDGYLRVSPVANVGAYMEARNITGRSGTTKTLSTSTPSGGSNGDIWYRYS